MSFEFNEGAFRDLANQVVTIGAEKMQTLLDEIRSLVHGMDVELVKATLATRWRESFGRDLTDSYLNAWAEQLATGGRVIVKPELTST